MEQRRPRLGDILDDYCPRERRVTNHAVVAMIDDEIRQTRCVTCDAEHVYKAARIPPRRKKKETPGVLYDQVLAGMPDAQPRAATGGAVTPPDNGSSSEPPAIEYALETSAAPATAPIEPEAGPDSPRIPEDGPVRRPLIRATLPRPEGQPPARPLPDFTVRQNSGRDGGFRDPDSRHSPRGQRPPNGGKAHGQHGPARFGRTSKPGRPGNRSPQFTSSGGHRGLDRSPSQGGRPSRQHPPARYGKKRSR